MVIEIIAYSFIGLGLLFAAFGVLGLFRFDVFYTRILVSANVDTVGMLLMLSGAMIMSPDYRYALKILLIIVLSLITTPLSNHATARSAHVSGLRVKE